MLRSFVSEVAVASLLFGAPALAQDKSGWEIHGGVGPTVIRDEDGTETFRDNSFGLIVGGGYRFNNHFALGINVVNLGTGEDTIGGVDTEIDVTGISLTGRIIFPVSEKVEVFGLIGNLAYDADVSPGFSFDPFGSEAWEFGAGVDVATSESFSLRFAGRYYDGRREESGGLLTFGFSYRF